MVHSSPEEKQTNPKAQYLFLVKNPGEFHPYKSIPRLNKISRNKLRARRLNMLRCVLEHIIPNVEGHSEKIILNYCPNVLE